MHLTVNLGGIPHLAKDEQDTPDFLYAAVTVRRTRPRLTRAGRNQAHPWTTRHGAAARRGNHHSEVRHLPLSRCPL